MADLKPFYLALVNKMGGVDMLARFMYVDGTPCDDNLGVSVIEISGPDVP